MAATSLNKSRQAIGHMALNPQSLLSPKTLNLTYALATKQLHPKTRLNSLLLVILQAIANRIDAMLRLIHTKRTRKTPQPGVLEVPFAGRVPEAPEGSFAASSPPGSRHGGFSFEGLRVWGFGV